MCLKVKLENAMSALPEIYPAASKSIVPKNLRAARYSAIFSSFTQRISQITKPHGYGKNSSNQDKVESG